MRLLNRSQQRGRPHPLILKGSFRVLTDGLDNATRASVAEFAAKKLSANPETSWMAEILTNSNAGEAEGVREILREIKSHNDQLYDKSVWKGLYVRFMAGEEGIELADVPGRLQDKDVQMNVVKYEKPSLWLLVAGTLFGVVPSMDGVALKSVEIVRAKVPIDDPATLSRVWQDTKLLA